MKRAVVIGGGLGGLETGLLLARSGYSVTVLEKEARVGGCIQSFTRRGTLFDTGLHCVGGLEPGSLLEERAEELGFMKLPWSRMEGEEVVIGSSRYFLPSGYEAFSAALSEYFPDSSDEIEKYCSVLSSVDSGYPAWTSMSAYKFLCETISDPLLRKVLSGTSLKLELSAESLPLYVFARINDSYIRSSWRLLSGGSSLAETLAMEILSAGGRVVTGMGVASIDSSDGAVTGVTLDNGNALPCDLVVSSVHPALTASLAGDGLRKIYARRVSGLPNTSGFFTVNIKLKEGAVKYLDRNVYVHSPEADLWNPRTDCLESVMVSFGPCGDGLTPVSGLPEYAGSIDLLTRTLPADNSVAARRELALKCIAFVSERFPELADSIDGFWTSTPSTYGKFTSQPGGTAYGIVKDFRSPDTTFLSSRTPLRGLYLAGESLGLHGVFGVTMTSYRTFEEIKNTFNI